jgi:hypothetical protein
VDDLEAAPIGWQPFILGNSQVDPIAFQEFLDPPIGGASKLASLLKYAFAPA